MIQENSLDIILAKELYRNPVITIAQSSHIEEFDIKAAHLMAIKLIAGEEVYKSLKDLPKLERNIRIGKMQINHKGLTKKLQEYLLLFKKEFILKNKIKRNEIVETTKDSITLINKIPTVLSFDVNGTTIDFTNKEGTFTTYYRLNGKSIYFDSVTRKIWIKGINKDIVRLSQFIKDYYLQFLISLEVYKNLNTNSKFKNLKIQRYKYIESDNKDIYRSLAHNNKFIYNIKDQLIESDSYIPDETLIIIDNYKNYVMPLFRTMI